MLKNRYLRADLEKASAHTNNEVFPNGYIIVLMLDLQICIEICIYIFGL